MSNEFNSNMNNLIELNKKVEIVNDCLSKNLNYLKTSLQTKLANTNNDLNDLKEIIEKKECELKQLKELYEILNSSKVVCEQLNKILKENDENVNSESTSVASNTITNSQELNNGLKQSANDPRLLLATKYKNKTTNNEAEIIKTNLTKCLSFKTIDYDDEDKQNNEKIVAEEIKTDQIPKQINFTELKILEFLNNLQAKSQITSTTTTVSTTSTTTTTTTNNAEAMDTIVDAENISLFESPMLDVSFKKQQNLDDTLNATQASLNLIILEAQQASNNINEEINDVNSPPTPTLPQGDEESECNDAMNFDNNPIAGNLVQRTAANTVNVKDGRMKMEKNKHLENILMKRMNSLSKIIEGNMNKLKSGDEDGDDVEARNKFIMESTKSLISYDFCKNKNKQKSQSGDLKVAKFKKKALTTSTPACSSHNLIGSNNNRRTEEADLNEINEYLFSKINDECIKEKESKSKLNESIDIYGDLDVKSDTNKTLTNQKLLDDSLFDSEIFKSDAQKPVSNTNPDKNSILNEIKNENTQKLNSKDDKNRSNKDEFKPQSKRDGEKSSSKDRYDHRSRLNSHHHSSSSHSPSTNRKDRDKRSPFRRDYRTPDKHNERKTDNNNHKREYDSKYDRKRYDSPSSRSNDDLKKRKLSPKSSSNSQNKQAKWK